MPVARQKPPRPPDMPRFSEDGEGARMGFFEHLNELRTRVTRAFIGIALGTVIGAMFADRLLIYLGGPYTSVTGGQEFVITTPTGGVVAYFRVALLIGAVIAVPIITQQIVMFVTPGMTKQERRIFFAALPLITLLFLVGVAFAWFILIPPALNFLVNFESTIFEPLVTAQDYLNFVVSLLFWMGVAFETPLVLFVLSLMGFITPRPLARNWRLAVVIAAVAAALITPTVDPVNMSLVMGPLMVLYIISIGLVVIGTRIFQRRTGQTERAQAESKS